MSLACWEWTMLTVEQRLAEFRARKVKTQLESGKLDNGPSGRIVETLRSPNSMMRETWQSLYGYLQSQWSQKSSESPLQKSTENVQTSPPVSDDDDVSPDPIQSSDNPPQRVILLLKFLLWLVLLGLFVELEFGLAYFIISMFYWLYQGTRKSGEKKNGEKSAYSVFNPGCEAIQGTLTAEQLQRELFYGPVAGL